MAIEQTSPLKELPWSVAERAIISSYAGHQSVHGTVGSKTANDATRSGRRTAVMSPTTPP